MSPFKKKCTLLKLDSVEKKKIETKEPTDQVAKKGSAKKKKTLKIELSDIQKDEIKQAFDILDSQGTGFIDSVRTLKVGIKALGFEGSKEEVKKMIALIETDGYLSFDDFLILITAKINEKDSKEDIIKSFRLMDKDDSGSLTFDNLKSVAQELGENITDEQLMEMIQEADRNGNGEVNQEEFLRIMKKRSSY